MDRALRETREALAEVDADVRHKASKSAASYLEIRLGYLQTGAVIDRFPHEYMTWHGISGFSLGFLEINDPLSLFDHWLAFARKAAQP
jgi:hypothetical protein